MAEEAIGGLKNIDVQTSPFVASHVIKGKTGTEAFLLHNCTELKQQVDTFRSVDLHAPLNFTVNAPISATVAYSISVCVIVDRHETSPAGVQQVRGVGGSCTLQLTTLNPAPVVPLHLHSEITLQIKPQLAPKQLPRIVVHWSSQGTTDSSEAVCFVEGKISLSGVAQPKTW